MSRILEKLGWFKKKKASRTRSDWSSYLEKHDYYAESGESGSYGRFPRLPFSLTDLLSERLFLNTGVRVFICCHGSSAHWFVKNGASVVLARACRHKSAYAGITYLPEWKGYSADDLDVLFVDSHQMMEAGVLMLPHLTARGIVIVCHRGMGKSGMNSENQQAAGNLRSKLLSQNWKVLRFVNPAPELGELTADLWYRPGNLLNL